MRRAALVAALAALLVAAAASRSPTPLRQLVRRRGEGGGAASAALQAPEDAAGQLVSALEFPFKASFSASASSKGGSFAAHLSLGGGGGGSRPKVDTSFGAVVRGAFKKVVNFGRRIVSGVSSLISKGKQLLGKIFSPPKETPFKFFLKFKPHQIKPRKVGTGTYKFSHTFIRDSFKGPQTDVMYKPASAITPDTFVQFKPNPPWPETQIPWYHVPDTWELVRQRVDSLTRTAQENALRRQAAVININQDPGDFVKLTQGVTPDLTAKVLGKSDAEQREEARVAAEHMEKPHSNSVNIIRTMPEMIYPGSRTVENPARNPQVRLPVEFKIVKNEDSSPS